MIYLDPSVIFSLYCTDSNTPLATALIRNASESLVLTPFCELETLNAFSLGLFRKELLEGEAWRLRHDFELDLKAGVYQLRQLPAGTFARAKALAQRITPFTGVRAADLLHIAAALELGAKIIYTLDQEQHQAAQAAGLTVNELPNPYPRP
jgi:predicted nucleic acid-binding protein